MLGAVLAFSTMAVAGREIYSELNTFQLMFYRSIVGLVFVCIALAVRSDFSTVRTTKLKLHAVRNLFHFAGQNLWFYGVAVIPLAQLVALEFTMPIWVAVLAPVFLAEAFTRWRILAAFFGFCGVLIVARPGVVEIQAGHLAGLFAAVGFAGNLLVTKRLSDTDSTLCILFWMTAFQIVFGLVCSIPFGFVFPSGSILHLVFWVGIAGIVAHFCLTSALANAPASVVSPMEFLRLPIIAVVGMLLYGEPLELAVFAGGVLILIGNLINIRAERRNNLSPPAVAQSRTPVSEPT